MDRAWLLGFVEARGRGGVRTVIPPGPLGLLLGWRQVALLPADISLGEEVVSVRYRPRALLPHSGSARPLCPMAQGPSRRGRGYREAGRDPALLSFSTVIADGLQPMKSCRRASFPCPDPTVPQDRLILSLPCPRPDHSSPLPMGSSLRHSTGHPRS